MVAQQLTPELTQPNVLVEIDHGPSMGSCQEIQRRASRKFLAESMSTTQDALVSISTFSPAVEAGGCPEPSVGGKTTALTGMRSHGTKVKMLEGGSVGHFEYALAFHRPSWALFSKPELTILDTGEETAFIGMHLNRLTEVDNKQGAEPSPMAEKPTSCRSNPGGNGPLNSFEVAQAIVPSLPSKGKDWAKPISARGCPQRGLAQDRLSSSGDPKPLLFLTDQGSTESRDRALEYRHGSFNGASNVDNELVICEKKMAGYDKSAVIGKCNAFQTGILTRNSRTGRFKRTQSSGQENPDDVELLFSMSWCKSAKPNVNVDVGCIASEINNNLVSYSAS